MGAARAFVKAPDTPISATAKAVANERILVPPIAKPGRVEAVLGVDSGDRFARKRARGVMGGMVFRVLLHGTLFDALDVCEFMVVVFLWFGLFGVCLVMRRTVFGC